MLALLITTSTSFIISGVRSPSVGSLLLIGCSNQSWLKEIYPDTLTKRSKPKGSRTIWSSRGSIRNTHWLRNPCALWLKLNILGIQCTYPSKISVNIELYALFSLHGWFRITNKSSSLEWLQIPVNSMEGIVHKLWLTYLIENTSSTRKKRVAPPRRWLLDTHGHLGPSREAFMKSSQIHGWIYPSKTTMGRLKRAQ